MILMISDSSHECIIITEVFEDYGCDCGISYVQF